MSFYGPLATLLGPLEGKKRLYGTESPKYYAGSFGNGKRMNEEVFTKTCDILGRSMLRLTFFGIILDTEWVVGRVWTRAKHAKTVALELLRRRIHRDTSYFYV